MPHSTAKYIFEFKLLSWACDFAFKLKGENVTFLILFDFGNIQQILFGESAGNFFSESANLNSGIFFYDPFDAPEYTYIEWKNIDLKILEFTTNIKFTGEDLKTQFNNKKLENFPDSWSVMF